MLPPLPRLRWLAAALAVAVAPLLLAVHAASPPAKPALPPLDFADVNGARHRLRGDGAAATVYAVLSVECPVSNRYTPRLARLAAAYGRRGVRFVAVYPNPTEDAAAVSNHAAGRGLRFPITRETAVARALGMAVTPEFAIVDRAGALRYRGRLDDNDAPERAKRSYLAQALDAVLAGKPVTVARTAATGCAIALPKAEPAKAATPLTYTKYVAPILHQRCVSCHREGQVGPMPLDTYERAVRWAPAIKEQTAARKMPPWKANSRGEFHDEMRLSSVEVATLAAWADGGTPFGNVKESPPPPRFPEPGAWKLGIPDKSYTLPQAYDVPAEGKDIYRCFVIPSGLAEEQWVSGVEYQPDNRAVVHHMSAFLDTTGQARKMAQADPTGYSYVNPTPANGPGFTPYAGQLGGWTPGHEARLLPPGVGIRIPKGADLIVEVHYHLTGKPEKDRSRMAVFFAKGEVRKKLRIGDVTNSRFRIPPGAPDYKVEATAFTPADLTLLSVTPHMHYLGKSMRVTAQLPDGTARVLVDVPDWNFRWQPSYRFKVPVRLPQGTRLDLEAHFDNSDKNPDQPHHPPRAVVYAENSDDEMCSAFFGYTLDAEDLTTEAVAVPAG